MREPDPEFADPRLAALYDALDADRSDLDVYLALVRELGAQRVLDLGCGTGSLAMLLANHGFEVTGVDPALASLDQARRKAGAERVRWIAGDATTAELGEGFADVALMTGNVAQVFVTDVDWHRTLAAIARVLRLGGHLVFETRRPEAEAWLGWDAPATTVRLEDGSEVVWSRRVTEVALPLVTFETVIVVDGTSVPSVSTLRFRGRDEVIADLSRHAFAVREIRDAPDRPGLEDVYLARLDDPLPASRAG